MRLIQRRFGSTPFGTFSDLKLVEEPDFYLYVLEPPWADNLPHVSCIPAGTYKLALRHYNRGDYPTLGFVNVPGRTHILYHWGNVLADTHGCPLPGTALGTLDHRWAVLHSQIAHEQLMQAYGRREADETTVHIFWAKQEEGFKQWNQPQAS